MRGRGITWGVRLAVISIVMLALPPAASADPGDDSLPWALRSAAARANSVEVQPGPLHVIGGSVAWEPTVAADPLHAGHLAVTFEASEAGVLVTRISISRDGGVTWHKSARLPWAGTGRVLGIHPVIAWGPGPGAGTRLYWAGVTSGGEGYALTIASSDDEGAHWSPLYLERRTPPWVGGFPTIATDSNPASPGYGQVYVAYNWLASSHSPGLRLLASSDFGTSWSDAEVAPAPSETTDHWRIGYRLATAPDGSAYVAAFQADLPHWSVADLFSRAGATRLGFTVTRFSFDPSTNRIAVGDTQMVATMTRNVYTVLRQPLPGMVQTFADPSWQAGIAVSPDDGTVFLAVGDLRESTPRGVIGLYRSADAGATWDAVVLADAPPVSGKPVSSYRPVIIAAPGGLVWVGFHTLVDLPVGTTSASSVGEAFSLSVDGGRSFSDPAPLHADRWSTRLVNHLNGAGLRDQAVLGPDGRIFYAFGSGLHVDQPSQSTVIGESIELVRTQNILWHQAFWAGRIL